MPGHPLTQEQKDRMAAGRRAARERKLAAPQEITTAEDVIAGRVEMPKQQFEIPTEGDAGYRLFLAGLDSETRELLPEAELRQIFTAQMARVLEEKRAAKKKSALDFALQTARMAAGLVPKAQQEVMETLKRNNAMTRLQIDLPPTGENGEIPDIGLRVDQRVFLHGVSYAMTEAQAASMRETMYRLGEAQLLFEGRNRKARAWMMSRSQLSNGRSTHIGLNPNGTLA
jgi:hypothetical protein